MRELTRTACKANNLIAQGNTLGKGTTKSCRPVRAKELSRAKAFVLTGRPLPLALTQGGALGYELTAPLGRLPEGWFNTPDSSMNSF